MSRCCDRLLPQDDSAAHHYANPRSPQALAGLAPDAPGLLIGTGLTMIDTAIPLLDQAHTGPIHAISRRGLLPSRHGEAPPQPPLPLPENDYARIDSPLVRDLLAQGMARPDPLNLGLDVTTDSAVINRWGVPSRQIYALGPVTRGLFWEITSVPDIREQCWKVAALIGERFGADIVAEPVHATGL